MPRTRDRYSIAATPHKSPIKIPLNDDRQEKAHRLNQHKAIQEAHLNSIRASATPNRVRKSLGPNSPHTPANDQDGVLDAVGATATPMQRTMPLLANFEEWLKMATDNKINANNSWNFALIDYFHDMSLLKEGDGVNFQKASCTLDGCVKIYTSRVDSVATDTGKLLSGLADSNSKKRRGADVENEDDEDEEGEEGENGQKKRKKRAQRSAEATLATSFEQLQNKKMELEFSIDPLFKKASADFDEGGAKGLLLNHLSIDAHGRIVFDSSDDAQDATAEDRGITPAPAPGAEQMDTSQIDDDVEIDISGLAAKYFPDLSLLDNQYVCPSMKNFDFGDATGSLDLPLLKDLEDLRQGESGNENGEAPERSGSLLDDDSPVDLGGGDEFDIPDVGFGEGGEAWAREAAIEPQARVHTMGIGEGDDELGEGAEDGVLGVDGPQYSLSMSPDPADERENILSYLDNALKQNWAGPEHWRIRRIKEVGKTPPPAKRKEKEPFEIDFAAPMTQAMADALYTPATSASTISLPKAQWKTRGRNLLPDDKHFNSKKLLTLFLKPKAQLGPQRSASSRQDQHQRNANADNNGEIDEAFWARRGEETLTAADDNEAAQGNYSADFFADHGLGQVGAVLDDDDQMSFADARDHFSPPAEDNRGQPQTINGVLVDGTEGAFGAQLVAQNRRVRPEYVQYARVAKKVDVRRLKDNMWQGMGLEQPQPQPQPDSMELDQAPPTKAPDTTLRFTEVMNNLQSVYPAKQMADISTSYCFICMLHLANEKGLVIENQPEFTELNIKRDFTADLSVGAD